MLLIICHVQILRIFVVTNILYMQPFFLHASCQLLIKVFFIHIQSVVDYILHHSSQLIDKYWLWAAMLEITKPHIQLLLDSVLVTDSVA